jgi:RimJ/RimL family protein N-acetyltransferase
MSLHVSPTAFTIRRLGVDDLPTYHALRLRALKARPDAFTSSYEEELAKGAMAWHARVEPTPENGGGVLLGAFVQADSASLPQLIGVVGVERKPRVKERHKAVLYGMYVDDAHAGKGVGRALLKQCLAEARAMAGLERLMLTVTSTNISARHLYASAGFELLGTEKNAIKIDGAYLNKDHMVWTIK